LSTFGSPNYNATLWLWLRLGLFKYFFLVITIIYQFEPKKKYVKELVDTDESDATSVNEESEKEN